MVSCVTPQATHQLGQLESRLVFRARRLEQLATHEHGALGEQQSERLSGLCPERLERLHRLVELLQERRVVESVELSHLEQAEDLAGEGRATFAGLLPLGELGHIAHQELRGLGCGLGHRAESLRRMAAAACAATSRTA
jgi:hypothetical protein